jgi:hypothetical protein
MRLKTSVMTLGLLAVTLAGSPGVLGAESPIHARHTDPALQWGPCPPIFPQGCEIAVLHGDAAKDDADVFLRVPGGYAIPPHRHTSPERMTLAAGRLEVTYAGQKPITLQVGDYAYGPAKAPHTARCIGTDACVLFIAFVAAVDAEPAEMKD